MFLPFSFCSSFSFLGCSKSVAALQDSLGKSAHSELALFALCWLVVTFPCGTVHTPVMIRLRVENGGRRVGQVLPSCQNRQISALDETADAPQSGLFSLLSSLFFLISSFFFLPSLFLLPSSFFPLLSSFFFLRSSFFFLLPSFFATSLSHAEHGTCTHERDESHDTALAQLSLSKACIGVRSLPFPPSSCPSVVVSAPVTYAVHGAVRTLSSVSLEERLFSRGPSPTSLAVSSSISLSVSSSVSPSMCLTV